MLAPVLFPGPSPRRQAKKLSSAILHFPYHHLACIQAIAWATHGSGPKAAGQDSTEFRECWKSSIRIKR